MRAFSMFLAITLASATAQASDEASCKEGLICASQPETVLNAIKEAGFRAKLEKDKLGDPMISSAASGYNFEIYFYGCEKAKQCSSLQFQSSFSAEPDNTPAYANAWNSKKRFVQASVEKQELQLSYDVSTIGGLNTENFADVVGWWSDMLGEFAVFVKEHEAPAKK
jgi:hypothetical protein